MTQATVNQTRDQRAVIVSWTLTDSENGNAPELPFYSDRSVQVEGDFDTATITIEGSNDGTNYHPLTDPQGNALAFTSAGIEAISELTRYIRPSSGAGTGSVDVTISILMRGSF